MRRLALAPLAALVAALAGCGFQGVTHPLPRAVVGTLAVEAPGKGIFAAQGCGACHTYAPAQATGKVGPDLDNLAAYAKQAKQPLGAFTSESITDPNKYVQPGFPKGVMPQTYKQTLSPTQLQQLVDFLTKPQSG